MTWHTGGIKRLYKLAKKKKTQTTTETEDKTVVSFSLAVFSNVSAFIFILAGEQEEN